MGHSAKRIIDALRIWDVQKQNSDEEYWQKTLNEKSYVISQVFAVPMIFIKEKAYVGGMNLDRKNAKFVDYLFSIESSKEAILVEIKAPATSSMIDTINPASFYAGLIGNPGKRFHDLPR